MSGYFLNGVDISNYLVESATASTTVTGFKKNGSDLATLYKLTTNGIGISQSYTLKYKASNSLDLSKFFSKKTYTSADVIASSTIGYTYTQLSLGASIWISNTGTGTITFYDTIKSVKYAMVGGGGSGGGKFSNVCSGGGGGGGEVIYGTYTNSTNKITSVTSTIGAGGTAFTTGIDYGNNGGNTTFQTNNNYINLTAYGGGGGGGGGSKQYLVGKDGGNGGGGRTSDNGGTATIHSSGATYTCIGTNGRRAGNNATQTSADGYGGGGGGSGSVNNAITSVSAAGGAGYTFTYDTTGSLILGAGGGGGAGFSNTTKGLQTGNGGGGNGGTSTLSPINGFNGQGGGGGGVCVNNPNATNPVYSSTGGCGCIILYILYTDIV